MTDEQRDRELLAGEEPGCQFPTGVNETCGEPIARSGAPGRPSRYCENPDHTRAKAFAARRGLERGTVVQIDLAVPERPVTDGRASFGALLTRFEDSVAEAKRTAAEQQVQFAAILERAIEVVRTVSDPDAAGYEVEQIQRETLVLVAEAQTAQAATERDAREARKKAETEAELRAQADEAAEEALQELTNLRAETAETIGRITAQTETALAEHELRAEQASARELAAREELEQVRTHAAETIAAARSDAERHKQETTAATDLLLVERDGDMRRQIDQARTEAADRADAAERNAKAEASALVKATQQELAEAIAAKVRAQSDQAAAERRADEDRTTVERLRAELDKQRIDSHQELAELRSEIRQERDDMRRERAAHAAQIAAVLSAVQSAADHTEVPAQALAATKRPSRATATKPRASGKEGSEQ